MEGPNARLRRVRLEGLEAGQTYEWRPVGGAEAGPQRTVTLVKGLAFGRSTYGGTIARDYDQRISISVRNHAEESQTVQLECGRPESELLLVGFVGDGSEGAPFELGPGQEREFLLGHQRPGCDFRAPSFPGAHRFSPRLLRRGHGRSVRASSQGGIRVGGSRSPPTMGSAGVSGCVNRGDTLTDFWLRGSDPRRPGVSGRGTW